jgi:predicted RND superfamily exporter protein
MSMPASPKAVHLFLRVLAARRWIAAAFLILAAAGIYGALRVPDDPAIERLIVAGDPVALATADFDRLFPEGEQALIMLEAPDPLSLAALRAADRLEHELARSGHIEAHSLLDFYRRAGSTGEISPDEALKLRAFATGTPLFRRAGLMGEHYFGIALELQVNSPAERDRALAAIDALVLPLEASGGPFTQVRRVGSPWLDAWLERQTGAATVRFMPLFGIFLMTLVLIIYRSWRALAAIVVTLGAVVAIAMGLADLFGWSHTVISTLVPLTVMVTTTATLVYIHSRFIEPDDSPTLLEHHARALANKFMPCTASIFATAVGFAALAISDIRPVRDMGLWTACGLVVAWIGCFTLFPALQALLRTPRRTEKVAMGKWFPRFVDALVPASRRYRWPLVGAALALMLCGAAALFGIPRVLAPIALEMDVLTYVNPSERVAQDTRQFEKFN